MAPPEETMALGRTSMRNFLITAKSALQKAIKDNQKVTFVIGNQSADLDSFTSSLVLSYIRSLAPPRKPFSTPYIPLLNIPRADISIRPEHLDLLEHVHVKPEDVITLDDIQPLSAIKPENTAWILVDHNNLEGELGEVFGERMIGCIDHHVEENKIPKDTGEEPRIVTKTGSCSSLVVEYVRGAWDRLNDEDKDEEQSSVWDAEVATLAMASVLIDTRCLRSKDKVTDHDVAAVDYLQGKIKAVDAGFDREKFWEELDKAKKNVGQLPLKGILKKDYKEWREGPQKQKLGVSSCIKSISFLLEKAGEEAGDKSKAEEYLLTTAQKFARDQELSIYTIMASSVSPEGEFQREIMVLALDDQGKQAGETFWKQSTDTLGLEKNSKNLDAEDKAPGEWRKFWRQHKTENSRKQVAPLLRQAMKEAQAGNSKM